MIRINKFLSLCGVASRRGAEELIKKGKVTVNDAVVESLGTIVDESRDKVKVDGREVTPVVHPYYVLLNKPPNVLTTLHDPFGRRTVAHLLKGIKTRVYPVGRLDFDTQGVLLLTNDGELAYRLAHPKFQIPKVYEAEVEGTFTIEAGRRIRDGIRLQDGHTGRAEAKILTVEPKSSRVRLTLTEGHKREVKQLLRAVGHPVTRLRRVEFAGLRVDDIRSGHWRYISREEVRRLRDLVGLTDGEPPTGQ